MRLSAVLSLLLMALSSSADEYTVQHLTGSLKGAGFADGSAQVARLQRPNGIDADSSGNVYVADSDAHTIRRITPDGSVTTFAGLSGVSGSNDGKGGSARFYFPRGIAVDSSNNVYVGESRIRRITPSGQVSTLASVTANAVAVDTSGNVYAAGSVGAGQYGITKITPAGATTLLTGTSRPSYITDVAVDSATGNVFFTSSVAQGGGFYSYNLYQRNMAGTISTIATGGVSYVAVEAAGTLVTTGQGIYGGGIVERMTVGGSRTIIAGTGSQGGNDGAGGTATFLFTSGIAVTPAGVIYVLEATEHRVRRISISNFVSTLAGGAPESQRIDGSLQAARFRFLRGIARDASGNVFVADGSAIRKITPAGMVSTLAGGSEWGYDDGFGVAARFRTPTSIALDASGNLFVTDAGANTIRKVTPEGMVTTFAGMGGSEGAVNATGTGARFRQPYGIAVDPSGNVYVADSGNHAIRKITPDREVTTFAGTLGSAGNADATGVAASFSNPAGIVRASDGTLYVSANNAIRRITTPGAEVSTFAGTSGGYRNVDGTGTGAGFLQLGTLGIDANDNLFAADNFMLRKVTTPGAVVTTVAGKAYAENLANVSGTGTLARFSPAGVTSAGGNDLYLSDGSSQNIRIVSVAGIADAATASTTIAPVGSVVVLGTTPETATNWTWTLVRRPTGSTAELSSTSIENPTFTPDVADVFVFLLRAEGAAGVRYSTVTVTAVDCVVTGSISAALTGAAQVCLTGTGGTAQATLGGGASGPVQWGWRSSPGGLITNIAGATSSSYIVNGAHFGGTGMKYLVATVVSNCGSPLVSNEIPVQISSPPDGTISASSGVYANSATNYASVRDAGPGATYTWSVTNGAIEAGQGTRRIRYSAGASGEVTVSVAIQNGCSANTQATVPIMTRSAGASLMYLVLPCRVIDTRDSWPVGDGTTRTLVVGGLCGIPVGAASVALNVTAIAPAAPGYASLYPPTIVWPGTSTLNYRTGKTRANNAVVALGPDGTLLLKNVGATTHFVVDVTGYFQ